MSEPVPISREFLDEVLDRAWAIRVDRTTAEAALSLKRNVRMELAEMLRMEPAFTHSELDTRAKSAGWLSIHSSA